MNKYEAYKDMALIFALKADEERALTELYNRYWDKLLVVSLNRLSDPEAAQEIVQDVFTKLWQRRNEISITSSVSAYLNAAVKYSVIDRLDSSYQKRKVTKLDDEAYLVVEPSFEAKLYEKELMLKISQSVEDLPGKCKIVFKMSRESGLTYKQIARQLSLSEKTIEAHMSKALKIVRVSR